MNAMTTREMSSAIGCNGYDMTRAIKSGMSVKGLAEKMNTAPGTRSGQWMWTASVAKTRKALIDHVTKTSKILLSEGIKAKFGAKKGKA